MVGDNMDKIKLGFASDHRGYLLKEELIKHFKKHDKVSEVIDCGSNSLDSCDYPDYAKLLGREIQDKSVDFGVAICGSGIGISIALNKINGVYCAKCNNALEASYTRLDNNTNVIAFSGDTSLKEAINMVETFITTDFSNLEKHKKRIQKVKEIEAQND